MPVRAQRVCRVQGCGNATGRADGYCEACNDAGKNESAEARKSKQTDPFYLSTEWRRYSKWWRMCHPLCAVCGRPGQMVDHTIPIKAGGAKFDPKNTKTQCWSCHNRKTGSERAESGRRAGR